MAIKKEVAKEKAIKGGMPSDVADNIFRMQMGAKETDTPSTFSTKNQKVMAMSTMYQTEDPEGTRPKVKPITSNLQIVGTEPITATQVSTGFSGGGVFENQEQKDFYDTQITQRTAAGMTQDQAIQDYRNTFKIGEEQFKTELSGGKTKYADNPFGAFSQGLDDVVSTDKKKTGSGSSKPSKSSGDGMVDTFTSYDTRQAGRKAIVEARKLKRARLRALRAKKRAGGIKDETMEFGGFGPGFDGEKVTKSKKQVFKDAKKKIKQEAADQKVKAMEKIAAQGQAQRAAAKNPATTKEFDPNQAVFPMKVMQFRKKYKK